MAILNDCGFANSNLIDGVMVPQMCTTTVVSTDYLVCREAGMILTSGVLVTPLVAPARSMATSNVVFMGFLTSSLRNCVLESQFRTSMMRAVLHSIHA